MKNLKKLEREGYVNSKSYGIGEEKLWSIKKHKQILAWGYDPAKAEVHKFMYEHEKACADVCISLFISGKLDGWGGEGDQKKGFRWDRKFQLFDSNLTYLEVEMGSQGEKKLRQKLEGYIKHFRETKEEFHVLLTVRTEEEIVRLVNLFEEYRLGNHYAVCIHDELVQDALPTQVTTRFDSLSLAEWCSKQHSKHAPDERTTANP